MLEIKNQFRSDTPFDNGFTKTLENNSNQTLIPPAIQNHNEHFRYLLVWNV